MSAGILVIRGGAIGDFVLTLPAILLLREAFPATRLEILGYKHIIALAEERYYAHATRSIEYGGLAPFFIRGGALPEELVHYFSSFGQIISYLYDPDGFFEENLRRAGVKNYIGAYKAIQGPTHAARQLAQPLERLALFLDDTPEATTAPLHLTTADRDAAHAHLAPLKKHNASSGPIIAVHPGSGGTHKLWPLNAWATLLDTLENAPSQPSFLIIGGEADTERLQPLLRGARRHLAFNLPLPHVAALIRKSHLFLGHDSGISHIAAATGTESLLLFGPTDPSIWAPTGSHVTILRGENGTLETLQPHTILALLSKILIASEKSR